MSSFYKADVFFFITAIAVVVVSVGVAIALVYIVRILRDVKELSGKAKDEGGRILDDVRALREDVKAKGFRLADLLSVFGIFKKTKDAILKKPKVKKE